MNAYVSLPSFIVGALSGLLIALIWVSAGDMKNQPVPASSIENFVDEGNESGAISVGGQPSGIEVFVESVTVPPPGVWVAVREMNGRELGNVLGALRVPGPQGPFAVSLLRATEPARTYAIQLYRNDNNGEYDPQVNSVYVDFDTGKRVVAYFTTTAE
jgi:hypothetical protein